MTLSPPSGKLDLQTDKGKPGESRGRKAMGLTLLNELRLPGRRRSASKHHSHHRSNSEEAHPRRAWSTSQVLFCCSPTPIAPHHCQRYSATPLHHSRKAAPSQPTSQPATAASKPHRSTLAASSPPQRSQHRRNIAAPSQPRRSTIDDPPQPATQLHQNPCGHIAAHHSTHCSSITPSTQPASYNTTVHHSIATSRDRKIKEMQPERTTANPSPPHRSGHHPSPDFRTDRVSSR